MIIYIKQTKKPKLIYKTLSIFKTDTIEDKTIIYLPINNKTRKKKTEKVMEKLSQFFYEKAIKNVVLEQELEQNKEKGYSSSSVIGKDGLEKAYEDRLRAVDGKEIIIVDEKGNKIKQLAKQEGVTEKLKATDMMLWVQKMNNIRNRATEIVNAEIIFS